MSDRDAGGVSAALETALDSAYRARESGDIQRAAGECRRILETHPEQPHALHLLGMIALEGDRIEEAERLFRQLSAAAPDNALGPAGLGALGLRQNRLDEAVVLFRRSLALAPAQPDVHNNLGLALLMLGDHTAAEAHFGQALELFPDYADVHLNLGKSLFDRALYEEAGEHYARAAALAPGMVEAHNNLGNVHRRLGRLDAALDCYRAALDADPEFAIARYNAAITKVEQGRLADALADFESVATHGAAPVQTVSNMGEVLEALGRADEAKDWYRKAVESDSREDRSRPWAERRARHFALGRMHDRLEDYDAAFTHFEAANDLWLERARRAGGGYDPVVHERRTDAIIAAFPADASLRRAARGEGTRLPVFVLGMPRSGTSLVEQILASHSEVHGAGELPDIARLAEDLAGDGDWMEAVATLDEDRAGALAADYLDTLRRIAPAAGRVVNKLPMNFLYIGLIRTLFPAAPVVHCRRDARDTCLSNYVEYFAEPKIFTNRLADLGHFYGLYERLMAHWDLAFPGAILHLDYERLIDRQEAVSRELIEHCGLRWEPGCLTFHETERPVQTASRVQVRRPIYRSSLGRWRNYERHLGPLEAALRAARGAG